LQRRVQPWTLAAWGAGLAGVALRLHGFGAHALWNDEAWVALSTRVEGWQQFWLALSVTPIGWAAGLRLLAWLPGPPEVMLRLLPLGFAVVALWLAWRIGREVAGHPFGGVVACAALAVEPWSIVFARTLKPYSAEACLALAAMLLAIRAAEERRGALPALALVLAGGGLVATSQLLVAPPVLGALLVLALARRARGRALAIAGATAVVGVVDGLVYRLLVAPRLLASLDAYWEGRVVTAQGVGQAVLGVARLVGVELVGAFGPLAVAAAAVALVVAAVRGRAARLALPVVVLLLVELGVVALRRPVPTEAARVLLFALTLLLVCGAAALGTAAALRVRGGATAGLVLLLLIAGDVARRAPWRLAGPLESVEDLGPLVRLVERSRAPDDVVLVYERSLYVWAYYRRATPVLQPNPLVTVGFVPRVDDPRVLVVGGTPGPVVQQAFTRAPRVWALVSRPRGNDERVLRVALMAHGTLALEERAARALVLRVDAAPRA
jgi:hypothetical protein